MSRTLYSALLYLLCPLILLRLWLRGRKAPAYRLRIAERFGYLRQRPQANGLWVHAVSVGETIAAAPLILHFLDNYPELPVVVTTMTPTGSERVKALFGDRVFHCYAPYDLPGVVNRFLNTTQPGAAVIMETEVWPNMVCQTAARGIPVLLANGRMSARSAKGYGRFSSLVQPAFAAFDQVLAQSEDDARRFIALGARPENVAVSGSVKFDVTIGPELATRAAALRDSLEGRPVWVAASTHYGEDEILLAAHRQLLATFPDLLLVLVPRHPERFSQVAELVASSSLGYSRRSAVGDSVAISCSVLLGDTMGELMLLLGAGDLAFVGGSLIAKGGHNSLEPAAWGIPVITGESDFNFAEISSLLQASGGLVKVSGESEMAEVIARWLADPQERRRCGAAAKGVVEANRGALARLIAAVDGALAK